MGSSRAWRYRLQIKCASGWYYTPMEWRVRTQRNTGPGFGKPTTENIDRWVTRFEWSMIHGPNRHLGQDRVVSASIVDQHTGDVVAEWSRKQYRPNEPSLEVVA